MDTIKRKNFIQNLNNQSTDEFDVLKQMTAFNKDAPINVTIIFEEPKLESSNIFGNNALNVKGNTDTIINTNNVVSHELYSKETFENIITADEETNIYNKTFTHLNWEVINTINSKENNKKLCTRRLATRKSKIILLLNTLSKNLIRIIQYGYDIKLHHLNDPEMYEKAKDNYRQYKKKIFNASYHIVDCIFLPQETNYKFIENFIKRTHELALNTSRCFKVRDYREVIVNLLSDLIKWTKQKKMSLKISKPSSEFDQNGKTSAAVNFIAQHRFQDASNIQIASNTTNVQEHIHLLDNQFISNQQPINSETPKRNWSDCTDKEGISPSSSKRKKIGPEDYYYRNTRQVPIQNYLIYNNCRDNVSVNNNDLSLELQSSGLRTVSRDNGFENPQMDFRHITTAKSREGLCKVCKINTRLKRLGYHYHQFYCSLQCQQMDSTSKDLEFKK